MNKLLVSMENSQDWERVCDIISEGIYITNAKGKTLYVNQAYENITGIPKRELVGKDMEQIVKEGWLSTSITQQVILKKKKATKEQIVRSGKKVVLQGNPVFFDGEIQMVVTFVRDITSINKMQEDLNNFELLIKEYKKQIRQLDSPKKFVAESKAFLQVIELARKVANVDSTVLILGESGTGKEVVAKEIHENSHRANQVYSKINCGAIPENLLEAELFGYEPGAFTGAKKSGHMGIFEMASTGTVFLDEIGDMPLHLQVKLLRVLQEKHVTRIGGNKDIKIDTRVIAATNCDLAEMVKKGTFRKDLYYRLNVIDILVPPLRERREEIPHLINYFVEKLNEKYGFTKTLSPNVIREFMDYDWPGNVRELENMVERIIVTSDETITVKNDMEPIHMVIQKAEEEPMVLMPLKEACEKVERELILAAAKQCKTTYEMAKVLGISQPSVSRKLNKYMT